MNVQCYLNFNGRCEEALNFYSKAIGAKVGMMMRFKDAPPQPGAAPSEGCASIDPNSVMHSSFTVGDTLLMATDGMMDKPSNFDGFSLALNVKETAEVDKMIGALSGEGGKATMPASETFFAKRFGMVQDKFGVHWMVIAPKPMG
jgi:PhnB protein